MTLDQLRIAMYRARAGQRLKTPDLTPVPLKPSDPRSLWLDPELDAERLQLYRELGTVRTARRLGVSSSAISEWALRRGLRQRRGTACP